MIILLLLFFGLVPEKEVKQCIGSYSNGDIAGTREGRAGGGE